MFAYIADLILDKRLELVSHYFHKNKIYFKLKAELMAQLYTTIYAVPDFGI